MAKDGWGCEGFGFNPAGSGPGGGKPTRLNRHAPSMTDDRWRATCIEPQRIAGNTEMPLYHFRYHRGILWFGSCLE